MKLALFLALATAAAAPSAPSLTLTLREAQALSPRELATRVLGVAGQLYPEAQASGSGPFGVPGLGTVNMARAPRSAGLPGLCVAETLSVSFEGGGQGNDPPRRPASIHATSFYRIVGDTNDRREWTQASERRQDVLCSRAGPVLDSRSGWPFFFGEEESSSTKAYLAARMLQAAMAGASVGPIACADDPAEPTAHPCADPRAALAALPTDRLHWVVVGSCAANRNHVCATLSFQPARESRYQWKEIEILIESDAGRVDPSPDSFRILSVAIRHLTMAV